VNQRVQSHKVLVAVSILSAWRLTAVTDNHILEPAVHIPRSVIRLVIVAGFINRPISSRWKVIGSCRERRWVNNWSLH